MQSAKLGVGKKTLWSNGPGYALSPTTPFHSAIPKNNLKIFATMHLIPSTSARADPNLFQRLFTAALSGRKIDVAKLMKHELSAVPVSITTFSGNLYIPKEKSAFLTFWLMTTLLTPYQIL